MVTTLATAVLVVTIGNLTFGATRDYKAEFINATGVVKGDDIRVAGVKVGMVKDVEIVDRTRAMVSFTVDEDTAVTRGTFATIRYRNLVGQRYIALTQEIGDTARLPRARRSRSTAPSRPWTSPCSSTASSRCSRRSRRPTSTSSPTRSSRSSRARAAPSRACSSTRRR